MYSSRSHLQRHCLITLHLASVGLYAIQFAALHGFKVVTTCSPRHFDRVKSLGADYAFDYRAEDVVSSIKKAVPGLGYVFDTIGASQSSATASQVIGEQGGVLCTVRPGKADTEGVTERTKVTDVLVWTAFLKDHRYGDFFWPVSRKLREGEEKSAFWLMRPRQAKTTMNWLLNCSKACRTGSNREPSNQACRSYWTDSNQCPWGSKNIGMGRYRATRLCISWTMVDSWKR